MQANRNGRANISYANSRFSRIRSDRGVWKRIEHVGIEGSALPGDTLWNATLRALKRSAEVVLFPPQPLDDTESPGIVPPLGE